MGSAGLAGSLVKEGKKARHSSYQLTLMTTTQMYVLRLPSSLEGEIPLVANGEQILSVYARQGSWYVRSTHGVILDKTSSHIEEVKVHDGDYWYLVVNGNRQILFAEANSPANVSYHHYKVEPSTQITIGRGQSNDIQFKNPYVSKEHAVLRLQQGRFYIKDLDSANGVFVNGKRKRSGELTLGDTVSILGMRIIIGAGFIAINSHKRGVGINRKKLEKFVYPSSRDIAAKLSSWQRESSQEYFNRLPRKRLPLKGDDITIDLPPMKMNEDGLPLILRFGGSAVMGANSLMRGNPLMLMSTLMFPLLSSRYTKKQREEYEKRRIEGYSSYLNDKKLEITNMKRREERILRNNYPEMDVVLEYPLSGGKLWERRTGDDDFLSLRLGMGRLPMTTSINYPKERFSLDSDELEDKMYALVKERMFLDNVPIMLNLVKHRVCGVTGPRNLRCEFARQMIMRIAMLYSYDEVKLILLAKPEDMKTLNFARYLPHTWDDQRTIRFVATNSNDTYLIAEYLAGVFEDEVTNPRPLSQILKERPYYLVIALDKQLQDCMEILKTFSQLDENCGLGVMSIFDDLPKDCTAQISLSSEGIHSLSNLDDIDQEDEHFYLDTINEEVAARGVFAASNKLLKAASGAYSLPKSLSFLDMFQAGKVSHLNIAKRWEESDPVSSLAAPIGMGTSGELFTLDLHQKYQGPHGLVAGMTGSGKSEFLLTYILSMALNYKPDEVSFLLIDYKGGGLAGAFEDKRKGLRLPHLAGTITNLDGSAIQRSLISLQSETLRRQRVFNEAKTLSGESTMDIYTYQRLYRQGVIKEPVSHLFIISDEFAELHDQQREFLDQLISIARIGRSLGIHLILATQKPGGLVDDQILSNTKFRVCLKVQTKADSNEMLKRPEAAELQETGRFYLQVGYNELFALGQSAWSGAPYIPHETVSLSTDKTITLIDDVGQEIVSARPLEPQGKAKGSQLSAVVQALSEVASRNQIEAMQLWTPPLAKNLDLKALPASPQKDKDALALRACMGMVDDPEKQEQYPYYLDFAKCNNVMLVGAARSGKTTFVQTLLLQLLRTYSSKELNLYILDYSSRMLGMFREFPHCGAALTEAGDEDLESFFNLIDSIVEERKVLFEELGVDSFEAARASQDLPYILVVIDNFSGISTSKVGENIAYQMDSYLKNGVQYGIKYLITANHANEVGRKARQELDSRFALQAKDKFEYSDILECKANYVPPELPGRGLCVIEGRPLELQVASIGASLSPKDRLERLKDEVAKVLEACDTSVVAKRLPRLNSSEDYEAFCKMFDQGVLPLGYNLDGAKPVSLPLRQFTGLSVYFGSEASILPVLSNFAYFASQHAMRIQFIKKAEQSRFQNLVNHQAFKLDDGDVFEYETTLEGIQGLITAAVDELEVRQKLWDEYRESGEYDPDNADPFEFMRSTTKPWLFVFESFENLCYLDPALAETLAKLLPLFHNFNMYVIGCFYPEDRMGLSTKPLLKAFNEDDLVLLFGGRYSEQKCTELPRELSRVTSEGEYDRCLMKYRNDYYTLLMPCKEEDPNDVHKDEQSIFM